mgnify:FL=1
MENIDNFNNPNKFPNNIIIKKNELTREEYKNINEKHILSLRKKRNNNKYLNHLKNLNSAQNQFSYELDITMTTNIIKEEELYIAYKNSENEYEKINYILQMIISKNINILKYGLFELKKYLLNIQDKNEFESKNLLNHFNEKFIRFLFELLLKQKNEYSNLEEYYQIMIILCNIISNLCLLNDFYINIVLEYLPELLQKLNNGENNQFKAAIYNLSTKILLNQNLKENEIQKYCTIEQNIFERVHDELIHLNEESLNNMNIFNLKGLFPTYINIINIIIYNNKQNIFNNTNINIKKLLNILSFINRYLNVSFMETDILKASLNFLSAILNFYKSNKNVFEKETENKFREIINNIELEKHIILYVYDNSLNNFEFRKEIIELINNMILLNDTEFINNLIKNGISEQISNLQEYLLESENDGNINENNMKLLYNLHIELIYNLISTQSEYAINDLCIENSCISNLFQLINYSKYCLNNNNSKIMEIFDLIIKSKTNFVHSLLLTEGIYDLYKNILFNCNNNDLLILILNDIAIMIERGKNIKTSNGINIISNHFIKNGIFDLIDNIKGRNELNEQINYLLDEISNLLK